MLSQPRARTARRLAVLTATTVVALVARTASAQIPGVPGVNPFSVGAEAGPAFPLGAFRTGVNTGFGADALLELHVPVVPIGLRLEGGYTTFGGKNGASSARVLSGSANAVVRLSPIALSLVRPYVIGGVGIYGQNRGVGSAAGVNVGAGLSVPIIDITVFADARYTTVFNSGARTNYVPVRVGLRY